MLSFLFYFLIFVPTQKVITMKKQAEYIKRIEIKGLWGRKNISWDLKPDVNILSGVNGGGKSTILNKSVNTLDILQGGSLSNEEVQQGVKFVFSPEASAKSSAHCRTPPRLRRISLGSFRRRNSAKSA